MGEGIKLYVAPYYLPTICFSCISNSLASGLTFGLFKALCLYLSIEVMYS